MKGARFRLAVAAAVALGLAARTGFVVDRSARAAERFFAAVEDLPLMPGLREVADAGVVFTKPQGRIIAVYAEGPVKPSAIFDYYGRALPALGWTTVGKGRFRREGELLRLDVVDRARTLTVRFSLSPN